MNEDFSHERLLQNIYKHLLEEDIDNIFEDKEWWRRVRPRDKKALRTLIGDIPAAKRMRHVKKGGAFHLDPPKYKGIKDHPGMGLLDEQVADNTIIDFLNKSKPGDELKFSVLKEVKAAALTVFKPGKTYNAIIIEKKDVDVVSFLDTELGKQDLTKEDAIEKLSATGKICDTLDCKTARVTFRGKEMPLDQLSPRPTPTKIKPAPAPPTAPAKGTGNFCDEPANNGQPVPMPAGFAPMVCKGNVATAIADMSLKEKTKENVVRRTAQDELKGANPQEINAVTKFFMDQPEIKSVGDIFKWFSWLLNKIWDSFLEWGAELLGIRQIGTKAVELATGAVTMVLTGGASAAVAQGYGGAAVLFGDSQMGLGVGKAWKDYVTDKGWQVCSGCKLGAHGTIGQWVRSRELQKILEKEKPTLVVIALGGWAGSWNRAPELIEKIKEWSGNKEIKIIWSGAPPIVKGYARYSKQLFDSRKKHNDTIKEKLEPYSDTVTFVDPYDYVLDFYTKAPPGDGLHMPESIAKKYVSKVTDGWTRVANKQKHYKPPPSSKKHVAEIVTEEAIKAGVDPFFAVTIARIESGLNPLSHKDNEKKSFKGLYQFGRDFKADWAKHGLEWDRVYEARHAAAAFMSAVKSRARPLGINPKIIKDDINGAKLYLSWQQGPCGIAKISKAAAANEDINPRACGRQTNLLYNMVNNIPSDRRKNYINNERGVLNKGKKLFITPKQFLELWAEKYRGFNRRTQLQYGPTIVNKRAESQKKAKREKEAVDDAMATAAWGGA
tara:strand:+ start:607 stop:2940 length:2334 start_codon:yes stop_codon:yes gene_type:complete